MTWNRIIKKSQKIFLLFHTPMNAHMRRKSNKGEGERKKERKNEIPG